jgi:lipopolysaccharide/colanic/teichoic acid biosynthesis glycosyltransferase
MKRTVDIVLSSLGLVCLAPLFLVIAALIKLESSGAVFYRGVRIGRYGRPFRIFKFRSMIADTEHCGPPNVSAIDPRVTRVGAFLRKTKLDELPQLINVVRGDMSIVGPRPELQQYVDLYSDEEKAILQLKPGITDWASITHFDQYIDFTKGDDPDKVYLEQIRPTKLQLQMLYLRNHSMGIDLKIVLWTVLKMVLRNDWLPRDIRPFVEARRSVIASCGTVHTTRHNGEMP